MRMQLEIDIIEIDDKETTKLNSRPPQLVMRDHLIKQNTIVLEQGGHTMTILFADLEAAIQALSVTRNRQR